jgi:hypothetical protein
VNGQDANAIKRHGLGSAAEPAVHASRGNCDVSGNGLCNGQDAIAVKRAALGLPSPLCGRQAVPERRPVRPACANCGDEGVGTTWHIEDGANDGADALRVLLRGVRRHDRVRRGAFEFDTTLVMAGNTGSPRTA